MQNDGEHERAGDANKREEGSHAQDRAHELADRAGDSAHDMSDGL